MEAFPVEPLRQYALLADGERGALIGPRGDIAFLCAPRWHDPGVFSSLIGGGGHYAVTPSEDRFVWGGRYEAGTLIWRSRWVTSTAVIECREALMYPADPNVVVVLRQIVPVEGTAAVHLILDPRPGFGTHRVTWSSVDHHVWEGHGGELSMRWSGASARTHVRQGSLEADLLLEPGQRHDLVLELSTSALSRPPVDPRRAWNDTEATWLGDEPRLADSLCPGDVRHSHAVLRGLTSRAGGMVAAGTMSLPERAERGSYDYRYAWIRDQCYAGRAAAVAGAWPLLDSAADFVADRLLADGPDLRPAYTVSGGAIPGERELHLPGYPGGTDKVGNRVNEQFQLDTLGEALLLFTAVRDVDRLGPQHVKAAHTAIDAIDRRWQQPDAGIWELDDRRWAHSRLMCAAGLRRWGTSKDGTPTGGTASRLEEFADVLVDDVDRDSLHVTGRWQRSPDDDRVDAALLLPGLRGAVAHDDPRHIATWQAVLGELADDYYLYRFSQGDGPLADFEGAFVLCGFQMALVSHQQGDRVEAARWFERNRGAVGPPGLYAEEFDVVQRQLRGNLPQAFVHALLIESAVTLHQHPTTSPSGRETP